MAPLLFGWLDFSVFGTMLVASALVGIYFGFYKKQDTKVAYLLGGKSMSTIPVAISLVACHISGVTVMGVPSEIYTYGAMYVLVCVSCIFVVTIMNYVYLPIFFELQLTSTYEYLEMRFSRNVRVMASLLYTIAVLLYMPIVVYVPGLAFSQVSGVSVHLITPVVCIICIFYTMLGGLKAVVWSDFIQIIVMVGSTVAIVFLGVYKVGGFQAVIQRSSEGGRISIFEFNASPIERNTFWTVLVGTTVLRTDKLVNQGSVQKFLSLPKMTDATQALIIYCIGLIIMKLLSVFTGLIIYTAYHDCDPVQTKAVKRADQLLAYFVMDIAGSIPGLPGLFVAGVFGASLSSMSSCLNCLAATIYEDFVRPCLGDTEDERKSGYIMKTIVLVVGAICVLLVFVVERLGGVLEISYSAQGITSGALLGLFSLGIFIPWANAKGALWGSITSLLLVGFIAFGAQNAISTGKITHKKLPTSVQGCPFNVTTTDILLSDLVENENDEAFILFRISYWYYGVVGSLTVIAVGMIVSAITGLQDPKDINTALIAPFLRRFIRKKSSVGEDNVELADKDVLNMPPEDQHS